jgi:hypothetical protein
VSKPYIPPTYQPEPQGKIITKKNVEGQKASSRYGAQQNPFENQKFTIGIFGVLFIDEEVKGVNEEVPTHQK